LTYSFKYLELRLVMIPTGEDPDKIASADWHDDIVIDTNKQPMVGAVQPEKQAPPKPDQGKVNVNGVTLPDKVPSLPTTAGPYDDEKMMTGKHIGETIGSLLSTKEGRSYLTWYAESGKLPVQVQLCKDAMAAYANDIPSATKDNNGFSTLDEMR